RRRPVVWTPSAQAALDGALEYIAQESLEGAQRVLHATLDLATSLETLSERGRIAPELDDPSVREVFVYSYRLIYEVRGSEVRIVAFLHGARDFARWWRAQA
ncbi:MAG TPA: type II toxin-antitoxin system RelE/ParE family toxin, partial [Patescibacteria group bacterium]|nr:type II toxin-antitoxin system RelE/ParE family toxin [Patescibacteria group bacterium]